jgi:hypothetical protein
MLDNPSLEGAPCKKSAGDEGETDISRSLAIGRNLCVRASTKVQNEENRAVMGQELLWAVCGF